MTGYRDKSLYGAFMNEPKSVIYDEIGEPTYLDRAKYLIYNDRKKEYGDAKTNFSNIASLWSILLDKEVTPKQVVQCMIALKLARLMYQPGHEDSWVDIAGYVGCVDKIERGE